MEFRSYLNFCYCRGLVFRTSTIFVVSLLAVMNFAGQSALAYNVQVPPTLGHSAPGDLSTMSVSDLKLFANDKYWCYDYLSAGIAIDSLLARSTCSLKHLDHECLEIYMNKAVCLMQENKLDLSRKILAQLLKAAQKESTDNNGGMDEPDCLFFLAECDYKSGSYKSAEKLYKDALAKYRAILPPLSADLSPCLDGLAGCLFRKNEYVEALPLFVELAQIDALNRGPDDLTTAWSLLNLSDVLKNLGRADEAAQLFEKAVYTFRQTNANQLMARYSSLASEATLRESIKSKVRSYVFGEADRPDLASGGKAFAELTKDINYSNKPPHRPYDFYNWRLKRTKLTNAPGLVTMNPGQPLKGLIVCIHGLGLHHGTYQAFADKMADHGFGIVAFDVRGFGSYRENKGYDRVDLDSCVDDIGNILKLLRRDYPNKSIFLLGESMGGAIALQVAAVQASLIDGLVCSVPSGSRFDATKTNVNIAFKFLSQRNKPFNIGKQVVKQATKNESLRKQWENDPEARLMLSATELVRFQKFMNQNLKAAEQLKNLPVVVFQGYGDKLVKPEGTLALYNALSTEDKDLIFVGHSEHLIFEEGQFKPAVLEGLNSWLCSHLKSSQP